MPAPPFADAPPPFSDASGVHNNATSALRRATSVVTPPPTLINWLVVGFHRFLLHTATPRHSLLAAVHYQFFELYYSLSRTTHSPLRLLFTLLQILNFSMSRHSQLPLSSPKENHCPPC
ncbi:hypothetical protein ACP275_09G055100 [Erythranthe tilingii]